MVFCLAAGQETVLLHQLCLWDPDHASWLPNSQGAVCASQYGSKPVIQPCDRTKAVPVPHHPTPHWLPEAVLKRGLSWTTLCHRMPGMLPDGPHIMGQLAQIRSQHDQAAKAAAAEKAAEEEAAAQSAAEVGSASLPPARSAA